MKAAPAAAANRPVSTSWSSSHAMRLARDETTKIAASSRGSAIGVLFGLARHRRCLGPAAPITATAPRAENTEPENSVIRCQGQYRAADREGREQNKVVGLAVHFRSRF